MSVGILTSLIVVPLIGTLLVYFVGLKSQKVSTYVTQFIALATAALSWAIFAFFDKTVGKLSMEERIDWIPSIDINFTLAIDGISFVLILLATSLILLVTFQSVFVIKENVHLYNALILLIEVGIIGVFSTTNLVFFYIFWELVLIPMFFLVGKWGGVKRKYTAIKFFIFTHVGSVLMLISFMVIFATSGSFDIVYLMAHPISQSVQIITGIGIFIGAAIKLPAIPVHTWQPDAYDQSPTPVSVLFAGLLAKMAGYAFIRLGLGITPYGMDELKYILIVLGIFGAFYSAFAAIKQKSLKRLVAYTSINHMSFVLVAIGVASNFAIRATRINHVLAQYLQVTTYSQLAIIATVFLMISHGISIGVMFLLISAIENHIGTEEIDYLGGLKTKPVLAGMVIVASVALISAPPLSGFIAEILLLFAVVPAFPWISILVVSIVFTAVIYLWLLTRVLFTDKAKVLNSKDFIEADPKTLKYELIIAAILFIPIIILGFFPDLLITLINKAAEYLMNIM